MPIDASQQAVFAAEPPATRSMVLGVSVSGAIGPIGRTRTSSITSPTVRTPASQRPAYATAIAPATRTLFLASARFTSSETPSDAVTM